MYIKQNVRRHDMDICPYCLTPGVGRISSKSFYCPNCSRQIVTKGSEARAYYITEAGNLVAEDNSTVTVERYATLTAISRTLGVDRAAVRQLARSEKIPKTMSGSNILASPAAVKEMIETNQGAKNP